MDEYVPSEKEEFMNENQRKYFKERLLRWRDNLLQEQKQTEVVNANEADILDTATLEVDQTIQLASRYRVQMLVKKIDCALKRIEEGTYGYCEETGERIDLRRLIARPIASLSLEAQERQEKKQKQSSSRRF